MIKIDFDKNYVLYDVCNKKIHIDYIKLFYKIDNIKKYEITNYRLYLIKILYIESINLNERKVINIIYSNKNYINEFAFFWFLCEYFFYKRLINLSDFKFFDYFLIADKFSLSSLLLLFRIIVFKNHKAI